MLRSLCMDEKKRFRYRRYDDDFKRNAVDLLRMSTKTIAEVACDLGIPYKTLESWHLQMGSGPRKPPADPHAAELARLRRQLAEVEMERDILKKALAICSRPTRGGSASS